MDIPRLSLAPSSMPINNATWQLVGRPMGVRLHEGRRDKRKDATQTARYEKGPPELALDFAFRVPSWKDGVRVLAWDTVHNLTGCVLMSDGRV